MLKNMENKYYTPEFEELFIGYECEILKNENWYKKTLSFKYEPFFKKEAVIFIKQDLSTYVRTKYLDESDILSLGWNKEESLKEGVIAFNKNGYVICYIKEIKILIISRRTKGFPDTPADYLFQGKIKSINELKNVLKYLGI